MHCVYLWALTNVECVWILHCFHPRLLASSLLFSDFASVLQHCWLMNSHRGDTVCIILFYCFFVLLLQEASVLFRVPLHGGGCKPSPWCSPTLLSTDGYTSFCLAPRQWARLPVPPLTHQGPWNLTGRDQCPLTEPPGAEEQSEGDQWSRCVSRGKYLR